MNVSNISDLDAKYLLQVKQLLIMTVKNLKFSLGEAKIADETIKWFDGYIAACSNIQKMEHEAKKKQETSPKTEGLGSSKIREFNPGTITRPKAKAKTKTTKGRK